MELGINGKRALVTGGTLGIGKAITGELLEAGVSVIVTGRSQERITKTISDFAGKGTVSGIACDLATSNGASDLVKHITQTGGIDILVNNVGYFETRPFFELSDSNWQSMFDINVMSGVRLTRALLPAMLKQDWGRIVFIASEQSLKPNPDMLHYAMTKTAQVAVARGVAEMTRGTRVTVNSVLVAPTWTEGVEEFLGNLAPTMGKSVEEMRTAYFTEGDGSSSLLGRFAQPDEIAAMVAFLCSSRASAINGSAQRVDGGIIRSLF
jgi:NAD(P)-dependent dehydrogenase (short-subunit alcohol dehydrogenase family)